VNSKIHFELGSPTLRVSAMKSVTATAILVCYLCLLPLHSQDVIQTGEWRLFKQEHPPLEYVVVEQPFLVREAKGMIRSENTPIAGATLEIGLPNGSVVGFYTGADGAFHFPRRFHYFGKSFGPGVPPGTYRFKATKDGFHSTVGTVIVSNKAPKQSVMAIELKSSS
jgi:hypothetical protein